MRDLPKTGNRLIDGLIDKRSAALTELTLLQEELQILKDVIRSKQSRIRKINQKIVKRSMSQQYIRLISSCAACDEKQCCDHDSTQLIPSSVRFQCISGGKVDT